MANDDETGKLDTLLEAEERRQRQRQQSAAQNALDDLAEIEKKEKKLEIERKLADLGASQLENVKVRNKHRQTELDIRDAELNLALELLKEELILLKERDDLTKEQRDVEEKRLGLSVSRIEAETEAIGLEREALAVLEGIGDKVTDIASSLTGIGSQWKETVVGSFIVASKTAGGFREALIRSKAALKENFSIANILGSSLQKMAQHTIALAVAQDNANASFNKATSTSGEYASQIIELERSNVGFGVSSEDAAASMQSLYTGMTNFVLVSKEAQTQLANTTARLSELGVATDTSAQLMENATLVLGMTASEADNLARSMASSAVAMSMPINALTENFNKAMPVLARWGKDAPRIFKKVQSAARSLGIETQNLLNIVGQFDTFEGAAQAAGKLNAILGGNLLNSTELLMADEAERLRIIKDSIDASGRHWESMNRFEKMAVASALGVSDLNEASKLMTQSMDKFTDGVDANALSQEELEQRMLDTKSVTEKFQETWRMFAVSMRPVIDTVHWLLDGLTRLNQYMNGYLIPTLVGLIALIKGVSLVTNLFGVSLGAMARSSGIATKLQDKFAKGIKASGKSAAGSVKSLLAVGGAVLMIGAGIGLAAYGVSMLAKAFSGLGESAWAAAFAVAALMIPFVAFMALMGVLVYTGIGELAAGVILAIGVGMFLMGASIAIAAYGVSILVKELGPLLSSIAGMAAAGPLGATGMAVFAASVGSLAAALALIKTDDLFALSNLMGSISEIDMDTGSAVGVAGVGIKAIAVAADEFDEAGVERVTRVFDKMIQYKGAATAAATPAPTTTAAAGGRTRTATSTQPVILKINGRVLGRAVVDLINKNPDLRLDMEG